MRVYTGAVLLCLVALTAGISAGGPETKYKAPRTESGQPDLRGVWNFSSDVPLQRPASYADRKTLGPDEFEKHTAARRKVFSTIRNFAPVEAVAVDWIDNNPHVEDLRTSLISYPEDGRLPKLVDGVRKVPSVDDILEILTENKTGGFPPQLLSIAASFMGGKHDGHEDFSASERCLSGAITPLVPAFDNYVQVIQNKDHIVLLTDDTRRIIPLDARPYSGNRLRSWSGESRGHWEGDTLVIETRNFNARPESFAGAGNAYSKVVVERLTRTSNNLLAYEATITDQKTFQDKIVVSFPMAKVDSHIYEATCHEGNYSLANTLSAARAEERKTAATH
jgi:hypothetical protein